MARSKNKTKGNRQQKGKQRSSNRRTSTTKQAFDPAGWWEKQPISRQHILVGLGLLVAATAFFSQVTFGPYEIAGSDTVQWRSMAESILQIEEETGRRPLWATHPFAGMPAYMISIENAAPQIDEIARAMRRVFWPTFQFMILLFGVYLLAFTLTRNSLASALAAIAFGFTTNFPVILMVGHSTQFVALSYAPWLLLTFYHTLKKPRLLYGLLFAIVAAIALRANHVQIIYQTAFFALIWWVGEGIGAWKDQEIKRFVTGTLYLGMGSVLALLLVAHPYLPQWEYKDFTIRGSEGGAVGALGWDYAMQWSQGWKEMISYLIAGAMGGSSRNGLYWGGKIFTEGPQYLGGVVVTLSVFAAATVRRRSVHLLTIGALVLTLFALGENAAWLNRPMFSVFPLFDAFRAPVMWLHVVELALAILAAVGLAELLELARKDTLKPALMAAAAAIMVVFLLMAGRNTMFSFENQNEVNRIAAQVAQMSGAQPNDPQVAGRANQIVSELKIQRTELFKNDAVRTLLVLAIFLGLLLLLHFGKVKFAVVAAGLVLVVLVDLWGVDRRYFSKENLPTSRAEEQVPEYAYDTYIKERVTQAGGAGHFRVLELAGGFTDNARPAFHYETLSGYHGAKLRVYQDFLENVLIDPGTNQITQNGLDLAGVRLVAAGGVLPGAQPVFNDEQTGIIVQERHHVPPRAYFVDHVELLSSGEATWSRLRDPSFTPRRMAVINEPLDVTLDPIDSTATAMVELEAYEPEHIAWNVQTSGTFLLVAQEVYYPAGWKASVDGEEAEIRQVNHFLRGIVVPAGAESVTMSFEPRSVTIGKGIARGTTLAVYGMVLLLLVLGYRRRTLPPEKKQG